MKFFPNKLKGTFIVPSSKAYAHRAIIAASLSYGKSVISNIDLSDDIIATINGMRALGASITSLAPKKYIITGFDHLRKTKINCNESSTTLRFLMPISLLEEKPMKFVGEKALIEMPLWPYFKLFRQKEISYDNEILPITISGLLKPGKYELDGDISAQFLSGLLFSLPLLKGDSTIEVPDLVSKGYVDLTVDVLERFGIIIKRKGDIFYIKGNQKYKSCNFEIEGDCSSVKIWHAANILGSNIKIEGINKNSLQPDCDFDGIIDGDVIDISNFPNLAPVLTTVFALREGETKITSVKNLAYKELNTLLSIVSELNKIGANIIVADNELTIYGVNEFTGGTVTSWGDYRIAMCLAIASTRCTKPLEIEGIESVRKKYPDFVEDFIKLGGKVDTK